VAGEDGYECRPSKEFWAWLDDLTSTRVPPMKRNAPDSVSEIHAFPFGALGHGYVQNDAPHSEQEIRKKHKYMESEENIVIKAVNAFSDDP